MKVAASAKLKLARRAGMILAASMVMVILLGTGTALAWDYVDLNDEVWISGLFPANGSTISTSSTTITATFEFADGDDVWGWSMTLDGVALSCSETREGMFIHVSCPVTNLGGGPRQYTAAFWGSYADPYTGDYSEWYNAKTVSFNVNVMPSDTTPPVVGSVTPSGTITGTSATIGVSYSDSGSGINTGSVNVTLDGSALGGCSVGATSASCSVSGLASGAHTIGGSVADNAGNSTPIVGSFSTPPPPPPIVSPHGGYGTGNAPNGVQSDLCLSCHDIHQAEGDYALMREATVTETCNVCHGLFGVAADGTWTETPIDLVDGDTGEATVSPTAAYENVGANRKSGHRMGVSLDANSNVSDVIPGSTLTLRVMDSAAYEEGEIYAGESVLEYGATNGLYCASCHTPHGSVGGTDTDGDGEIDSPIPVNNYNSSGVLTSQAYFGDQLVIDDDSSHPKNVSAFKLISSNPNHMSERSLKREVSADGVACSADAGATDVPDDGLIDNGMCDKFMTVDEKASSYNNWCLTCHDKQWNGSAWEGTEMHGVPEGGNNHPPLCVSCHSASGGNKGVKDFPHTSGNVKLLSKDHDGICLGCHSSGRLP